MEEANIKPISSIEEARKYIEENFTDSLETLPISDSLIDQVGINMAIIGDRTLKAGYMPNGFEQKNGYRLYKFDKH